MNILLLIKGIIVDIVGFFASIISISDFFHGKNTNALKKFVSEFNDMLNRQQYIVGNLIFEAEQPTHDPLDSSVSQCEMEAIVVKGQRIFHFLFEDYWFTDKYVQVDDGLPKINLSTENGRKGMRTVLLDLGSFAYNDYRQLDLLKPYFCHLGEMLKMIDRQEKIKDKNKRKTANKLRTIISPYELIWIYYECLFGQEEQSLKSLVEKYSILKHLDRNLLTITKDVLDQEFYDKDQIRSDFDYYLTIDKNRSDMFYIGAFYSEDEDKTEFKKAWEEVQKKHKKWYESD